MLKAIILSSVVAVSGMSALAAEPNPAVKRLSAVNTYQGDGSYRLSSIRFLRGDTSYPLAAMRDRDFAQKVCTYFDRGTVVDYAADKAELSVKASITGAESEFISFERSEYYSPIKAYTWVDCEKNNFVKKVVAGKRALLDGTIHLSDVRFLRSNDRMLINTKSSRGIIPAICAYFSLGKVVESSVQRVKDGDQSVVLRVVDADPATKTPASIQYSSVDTAVSYESVTSLDWVDCEDN